MRLSLPSRPVIAPYDSIAAQLLRTTGISFALRKRFHDALTATENIRERVTLGDGPVPPGIHARKTDEFTAELTQGTSAKTWDDGYDKISSMIGHAMALHCYQTRLGVMLYEAQEGNRIFPLILLTTWNGGDDYAGQMQIMTYPHAHGPRSVVVDECDRMARELATGLRSRFFPPPPPPLPDIPGRQKSH